MSAAPPTLRATYRLQFSTTFRLADATALVPYLDRLGVSHIYASPLTAARAGSGHGYDVVDFGRLDPALGTEDDLRRLSRALHDRGMGLIVDFVPNHMGIGGSENRYWLSVLEWGPESPWAHWFDIDWTAELPGPPHHRRSGKVLVPFLGDHYGAVLSRGGLRLRRDADGFAIWAEETHKLPVCPRDYAKILRQAPILMDLAAACEAAAAGAAPDDAWWGNLKNRLANTADDDLRPALDAFTGSEGDLGSWEALDRLIARQFWRASRFTLDGDSINYRRFFTVSDLAGIRVEDADVFAATHKMILRLLREGVVDGLRIDHIDGLRDPRQYLVRLREAVTRPFPLYVEKILGPGEDLPADWPCDGTTGYEFANQAALLLADPTGERNLTRLHAAFTGQRRPPGQVVQIAKREVMAYPMAAELEALTGRLLELAARVPSSADLGRAPLRAGLATVVAALDVYRTYAGDGGISHQDRARIMAAVDNARRKAPELGPDVFDFIAGILTLDLRCEQPDARDDILSLALRVQQFSGPVMAKGLEDKAIYRYNRLIALNEVGCEPGRSGLSARAFHRLAIARLRRRPESMLATSTHDTKRGEDARARILAISSHTEAWRDAVVEWRRLLFDPGAPVVPNDEYFFYQMLLGVWPAEWGAGDLLVPDALDGLRQRLTAAMVKSAREAGISTRWVFGSPRYEAALEAFAARALDPAPDNAFLRSFRAFAARIAADGMANGLIQTALKLTVPGVPDIYQGAELWEQSLVDPDNRRPVDFALRQEMLAARAQDAPFWTPDMQGVVAKLALVAGLLDLRRQRPELFAKGSYRPLTAQGPAAGRIFGFVREREGARLAVVAAVHPGRAEPDGWAGTSIPCRITGMWLNLIDRTMHDDLAPAGLLAAVPLAVLVSPATGSSGFQ